MCEQMLPARAVSAAAGTRVHQIARDPRHGASGECNWAVEGDAVALMLRIMYGGPSDVENYRQVTRAKGQTDLPGLGDEAFSSGDSFVVARKGKQVIALTAFTKRSGGAYFDVPHLAKLAKRALGEK